MPVTLTAPRLPICRALANSPEYADRLVALAYRQILARDPSDAELSSWSPSVLARAVGEMIAQMAASPELWAQAGRDPSAYVDLLYQRVLGRNPDSQGKAYWLGQLENLSPAAEPSPIAAMTMDGRPTLGGQNWEAAESRNEELLAQGKPAPVLFLGDSITDYLVNGVGKPVWEQYFAPLGAVSLAVPGLTTCEVAWQIQQGQVAGLSPRVVVLLVGTNNGGLFNQPPTLTAQGIVSLCQGIQDAVPGVQLLLLNLLPRGVQPTDPMRAWVSAVNANLPALLSGVHQLDLGAGFVNAQGQIPPALMADGLHPTELGDRVMVGAGLYATVRQLLGA